VGGEGFGGFAPDGVVFVVDDVVGAEGFEDVSFAGGAGCGDDAGAGGFGELCPRSDDSLNLFLATKVLTCKAKMLTPPVPCVSTVSPGFNALDSSP